MSGDSPHDQSAVFTGTNETSNKRQWFTPVICPTTPPVTEISNKIQSCESSFSKNDPAEGQIYANSWTSPNVSLPELGPSESNDENAGVQNFPSPKSLFKEEMRYDSVGEISTPTWSPTWSTSPMSPFSKSPTTAEPLSKRDRAGSFWETFNSLSARNSKSSDNSRPRLASDVIQRFESTQSSSFKEYRYWKETKWGEDNLDEVEFEDDDVNLELAIPKLFSNPVISMPSLGDFNNMIDDVWSRAVAYIISLCGMAVSAKYYLRRPRELFVVSKSALALWLPHPPEWICNSCMSMVDNGIIQTTAKLLQSMPNFSAESDADVNKKPPPLDEEDEDEDDDDDDCLATDAHLENDLNRKPGGIEEDSLNPMEYLRRVYPFNIPRSSSVWDTIVNVLLTGLAAVVGLVSIVVVTFAMLLKLIYEKLYRRSGEGSPAYQGLRTFVSRLVAFSTLTWIVPLVSLISNPFREAGTRMSSTGRKTRLPESALNRKRSQDMLTSRCQSTTPSTCTSSVKSTSRRNLRLPLFSFTEADFSVNRKLDDNNSVIDSGGNGHGPEDDCGRRAMSWMVSHFMSFRGKAANKLVHELSSTTTGSEKK